MSDEEILTKLGLEQADAESRKQAIDDIRTTVELRVIGLVSDAIVDDQRAEFERLMESENSEDLWRWLRETALGVDVSEVYDAIMHDYLLALEANKFEPNNT